ncbi:hypothetical protein CO2235_60037 [Cupriavidus oxalaticus]|jgi:hypothetical protein|uniref:Uncharacterized protein n=1 Tax=Cupriavidus oxalaticus TaxID=96344 RepID=A0A375GBP3_9BURK|nr:hypothetical protein CO2235_60037 [Cupriavidus oxalaticus]
MAEPHHFGHPAHSVRSAASRKALCHNDFDPAGPRFAYARHAAIPNRYAATAGTAIVGSKVR